MLKSDMLRACACVLAWTMFAVAELPAATTEGLTLKRFSNTALAGAGVSTTVLRSVESIKDCEGDMGQSLNCGAPSSFLLTGRLQPAKPGYYGFNVTLDPPTPYPSEVAYARLWVNDYLLFPPDTTGGKGNAAGRRASLYIPLPPRALTGDGLVVDGGDDAAANLSSYEVRLEYVCLSATGCGRTVRLQWADYTSSVMSSASSSSPPPTAPSSSSSSSSTSSAAAPMFAPPAPPPPVPPPPPFTAIPAAVLVPSQGPNEIKRRALQTKLQSGWGTFYHPSHLAWALLPESFVMKAGLYRFSTQTFLPPDGLTVNKEQLQAGANYALKAGLHSWNNSYVEVSVVWGLLGDRINVSFAAVVDDADDASLSIVARINDNDPWITNTVNSSDYAVILVPAFTHGRTGTVAANSEGILGISPGLRTTTLHVIEGDVVATSTFGNATAAGLPATFLGISLAGTGSSGNNPANSSSSSSSSSSTAKVIAGKSIVISTNKRAIASEVLSKTGAYRAREAGTLEMYGAWADVKDAIQTVLAWSFMYDPKEGLVAPMYQYTASCATGGCFSSPSINGDTTTGLFCWDGSFASYMLSMDALDLSFSNLIQIIKMRTAAGFIPSFTAGTKKTQDRSNPPVTANILYKITQRWGAEKTRWVVELCFEDLFNWNTWMYAQRTQPGSKAPGRMLAWGSNPYTYAPDGPTAPYSLAPPANQGGAARGGGGGAAGLESGLDNGPTNGVPFDSERHVQMQYDAGYTGMYLMDCLAQIKLAKMVGRDDAAAVLQTRFDSVNQAMLATLWNAEEGWFQNKGSGNGEPPMEMMAPINFYPFLAGPAAGPSEEQAAKTVTKHLTNASRFSVWPTASAPTDPLHAPPPDQARPLVQWYTVKDSRAFPLQGSPHQLCANISCSSDQWVQGSYIQRLHAQIRIEGFALTALPAGYGSSDDGGNGGVGDGRRGTDEGTAQKANATQAAGGRKTATTPVPVPRTVATLAPLYDYTCSNATGSSGGDGGWVDHALGPAGWQPTYGGACTLTTAASGPSLYVHVAQSSAGSSNLVPLELWYKPGDHYAVASVEGKADAAAKGYTKVSTLGYVWPEPGSVNASYSRYGLPSMSRDDRTYDDQDYWHGRIWAPMIQLVYWAMEQYSSPVVQDATAGLVAQSKALLLKNWYGYPPNGGNGSFAGLGRNVMENYGADSGEGYEASSSATPFYSWGALTGFIGLQANGYYDPLPEGEEVLEDAVV